MKLFIVKRTVIMTVPVEAETEQQALELSQGMATENFSMLETEPDQILATIEACD